MERAVSTLGAACFVVSLEFSETQAAGRRAWDQMREEQLNEQLRMLRVLAKRCAEKGEHVRARATISLIQEIEQEKRRRAARRERGGPSR